MKVFRVHVYFEACASCDVAADTREDAERAARAWFEQLSGEIFDTTVELDGRQVHVEDANGGINEIDVEEEPYEPEDPCPSA